MGPKKKHLDCKFEICALGVGVLQMLMSDWPEHSFPTVPVCVFVTSLGKVSGVNIHSVTCVIVLIAFG